MESHSAWSEDSTDVCSIVEDSTEKHRKETRKFCKLANSNKGK